MYQSYPKFGRSRLYLNKLKTQIISDTKDLADGEEIEGIKIQKSMRYLGMTMTCNRQLVVKDAKNWCKRFLAFVKGKVKTRSEELT